MKIPENKIVNIGNLSEAVLNEELKKGYTDMVEGRTKPAKEVFIGIRKDYDL